MLVGKYKVISNKLSKKVKLSYTHSTQLHLIKKLIILISKMLENYNFITYRCNHKNKTSILILVGIYI